MHIEDYERIARATRESERHTTPDGGFRQGPEDIQPTGPIFPLTGVGGGGGGFTGYVYVLGLLSVLNMVVALAYVLVHLDSGLVEWAATQVLPFPPFCVYYTVANTQGDIVIPK